MFEAERRLGIEPGHLFVDPRTHYLEAG
jgi:hypothetical protein